MLARAAYFTKTPIWKGTKIDELEGQYDPETHELYSEKHAIHLSNLKKQINPLEMKKIISILIAFNHLPMINSCDEALRKKK
jgi:hypothetical protein